MLAQSASVTISGRILDPQGRPAAIATVTAARLSYQEGRPTLVPMKTTTTNDRGEYRLYGLEPGEYFVRAEKDLAAGPARAYFPGSEDAISATKVVVSEGSEMAKTDFSLRSVARVKVSGTVTNVVPGFQNLSSLPGAQNATQDSVRSALEAEAAQISRAPQFFLSPMDPGTIYDGLEPLPNALTSAQDRVAGKFELRNVRSGTYELYAIVQDRSATPPRSYVAHTTIYVGLQDMGGVALTIAPGAEVNGHVVYMGNASPTATPVYVQLRPRDVLPKPAIAAGLSALVADDGTFTISNVPELRYSLSIGPLPRDAYVADIRLGSRPVFDRGAVTISRQIRDNLDVVIAAPAGAIRGTVSASPQELAAGITVTLVPEEGRWENVALYKRTAVPRSGSFSFSNVTPGVYKLFAWERIPDGAEQNAEFIGAYWDMGTEITVTPGNTTAGTVRLIVK